MINEFALDDNKNKKNLLLKGFVVGVVSQAVLLFTSLYLVDVLVIGFFLVLLLGIANEFLKNSHTDKRTFNVANFLAIGVGGMLASVFTAAAISMGNLVNIVPELMF